MQIEGYGIDVFADVRVADLERGTKGRLSRAWLHRLVSSDRYFVRPSRGFVRIWGQDVADYLVTTGLVAIDEDDDEDRGPEPARALELLLKTLFPSSFKQ